MQIFKLNPVTGEQFPGTELSDVDKHAGIVLATALLKRGRRVVVSIEEQLGGVAEIEKKLLQKDEAGEPIWKLYEGVVDIVGSSPAHGHEPAPAKASKKKPATE